MGGSSSKQKTVTESITDVLTSVVNKQAQDCSVVISGGQNIDVRGSGNILSDINMVQAVMIKTDCISSAESIADINNNIKQQLETKLKASIGGIRSGDSATTTAITNITNRIATVITNENLQNCAKSVNANQSISVDGTNNILYKIALKNTIDSFTSCVTSQAIQAIAKTDIDTIQKTESTNKMPGLFDIDPELVIIIVIGIIFIAIIAGFVFFITHRQKSANIGHYEIFRELFSR